MDREKAVFDKKEKRYKRERVDQKRSGPTTKRNTMVNSKGTINPITHPRQVRTKTGNSKKRTPRDCKEKYGRRHERWGKKTVV